MSDLERKFIGSFKTPVWLAITFVLVAYAAWETYWYTQVGLAFIKWHTHYMLYVYLWVLGYLLTKPISNKEKREKVFSVFNSVVFTLVCVEALFHLTGFNVTYIEKRSSQYQSVYSHNSHDSIRAYSPFANFSLTTPEFSFERKANQYGFDDYLFKREPNSTLIQTYGDSFTEGDGTPFDSSYPAILRQMLTGINTTFKVQNYGICGNDPGFYVSQYRNLGSKFSPSLIVLSYSSWDLGADFVSRGGLERFDPKGWHSRKGPWWEIIYGMNYFSRLGFHACGYEYAKYFMSEKEKADLIESLKPEWNRTFEEIANTARQNNVKILLVKKPEMPEVSQNKYFYDFAFFDELISKDTIYKHIDLMTYYRDTVGMDEKNVQQYYWIDDGHHNSKGYTLMAKGVLSGIQKHYPELFNTPTTP